MSSFQTSPLGVLTRKFNPTSLDDIAEGTVKYPDFSPAITGYTFMYLKRVPYGATNWDYSEYILSALSRGYTLPQITMSENTFDSFNPISLPGKVNIGTDFSVKMIDTTSLFATHLFADWFKLIRPLSNDALSSLNSDLLKKIKPGLYVEKYSTDIIVFTTDPGLLEVTAAVLLKGAWPSNLPMDILSTEISGVDAYTFTQNFKVKQTTPIGKYSDILEYFSGNILPQLRSVYDTIE